MAERGTAESWTVSGWPQSGQTEARRSPGAVYAQAEQWSVHFDAVIDLEEDVNRSMKLRVLRSRALSDPTG